MKTVTHMTKKLENTGMSNIYGVPVFFSILIISILRSNYKLIYSKDLRKYRINHKVNGASVKQILLILNHNVLLQLIIAFVTVIPFTFFIIKKFAFEVSLPWRIFIITGLILFIITPVKIAIQSYRTAIINPIKSSNK